MDTQTVPLTEAERVVDWREERLLEAGYPAGFAYDLATATSVDVTLACRLLAEGCHPATAYAILA